MGHVCEGRVEMGENSKKISRFGLPNSNPNNEKPPERFSNFELLVGMQGLITKHVTWEVRNG